MDYIIRDNLIESVDSLKLIIYSLIKDKAKESLEV